MFWRRRAEGDGDGDAPAKLTTLRDIVEIVAIVAAGAWAFYTFVYENQIKPAYSKPEAQVVSSLGRLGERKGLIAVRSHIEIHNIGSTDVWIYGFAETVTGSNIVARKTGMPDRADDGTSAIVQPYSRSDGQSSVFAFAVLTKLANDRAKSQFDLRPAQSVPIDRIFYVPANRFDELNAHVMFRFSAHAEPVAMRLETRDGLVRLVPVGADTTDGFDQITATLSLWSGH